MEEQVLKAEDLIIGQVYVTTGKNPGYIFLWEGGGNGQNTKHIGASHGCYSNNGNVDMRHNSSFTGYRSATEHEKEWMLACIRANKMVKEQDLKPTIKESYEIY